MSEQPVQEQKAHKHAKEGKANRKFLRDKAHCEAYAAGHRREHNKAERLEKYLAKHPNDQCALEAFHRVAAYA